MAKLMFIHHSGVVGGAGVSLINVVKTVSSDNSVTVYAPTQPEDILDLLEQCSKNYDFDVREYGRRIGAITYYSGGDKPNNLRFWYRLFLILKQWSCWQKRVKECDPDIVIVNSKILCWMSLLPDVRKRKSICFVRETMAGSNKVFINYIITKLLDKFNKVIFLSNYDKEKEGLVVSETQVVHNYVEESQFDLSVDREEASDKLNLKKDTFHVLYVGGVSEMKGFDLAVKSVLQCEKDVELIVAGNNFKDALSSKSKSATEYAKKWQEYIETHDKYKQIHMIGKQKNMSICYSACDVLLFPMRSPHQSRPAFEAGYFSKPVIITDFENIAEFVRDGHNGYTVSVDDIGEISEKIKFLKNNSEWHKQMGTNNLKNTDKLHNKEKNCELIKKIIKEMESL